MGPRALRRYAIALLLLLVAGLGATECLVRKVATTPGKLTESQQLVLKVMAAPNHNVVAGDSHVGIQDKHAGYAFVARGGITPWELEHAVKAWFRRKSVGRVMVESGPQIVATNRQGEWRSLAHHSLVRQFLPWNTYLLEPELINVVETRLLELRQRGGGAKAPDGAHNQAKSARRGANRKPGASAQAWAYAQLPQDVRLKRTVSRVAAQRPVNAFENSPAWQAHAGMLRWLVAKGGTVCMIRTPVTAEYEQQMAAAGNRKMFGRYRQAVAALARELGIRYVDYRDLGLGELPLDWFRNQDHLGRKGLAMYWPAVEKACFEKYTGGKATGAQKPRDSGR